LCHQETNGEAEQALALYLRALTIREEAVLLIKPASASDKICVQLMIRAYLGQ
jgi:hypothetical protein